MPQKWSVVGYDFLDGTGGLYPEVVEYSSEEEAKKKLEEMRKEKPRGVWFIDTIEEEEAHESAV